MRRSLFLGVLSCLCAFATRADQLTLKNGDRLTGSIIKSDGKTLVLKTDYAGDLNIQWDVVTGIVSAEPLHLALKDGETIVGTVTTPDSKFEVATKDTGTVTGPKKTLSACAMMPNKKPMTTKSSAYATPILPTSGAPCSTLA